MIYTMATTNVVIAGQLNIMFTVAGNTTYDNVEAALIAQGFSDYQIARQVYSGSTDITVVLTAPTAPLTGVTIPFPAKDTLLKLSTAASHFGGA